MTDIPTSSTASARVTLEDVIAVLGDTDPNRTNASALRALLGRGGNNTIQKHLDEIRSKRAAPIVTLATVSPPAAPGALVDAVWSAAWTHAQAFTGARLDTLMQERDMLKAALDLRVADHDALLSETDELRDALAKAEELRAQQIEAEGVKLDAVSVRVQELEAQLAREQAAAESLKQQLEQVAADVRRDLEAVRREAAHAAELAQRDAAIKDAAHQSDRAHLIDQVADLKSLLHRLSSPAPAPVSTEAARDI